MTMLSMCCDSMLQTSNQVFASKVQQRCQHLLLSLAADTENHQTAKGRQQMSENVCSHQAMALLR